MSIQDLAGNGLARNIGVEVALQTTTPISEDTTLDVTHRQCIWSVSDDVVITAPSAGSLGEGYSTALVAQHADGFTLELPTAIDLAVLQDEIVSIFVLAGEVRYLVGTTGIG